MLKTIKRIKEKVAMATIIAGTFLITLPTNVYAAPGGSAIDTKAVTTITSKIKVAVTTLAMPIGSVLIFICVVLTAIKLAVNHNNPKARTENLSSIGWLVIAGLLLGASLVVAGIIVSVTSNNGALYTS